MLVDYRAGVDRHDEQRIHALPISLQLHGRRYGRSGQTESIFRTLRGNIKIRPDGTVKVLDFGLAKATTTPTAHDPEDSPTISMAATQAGAILGTAAYMSPEQARVKPVDKRADIWLSA